MMENRIDTAAAATGSGSTARTRGYALARPAGARLPFSAAAAGRIGAAVTLIAPVVVAAGLVLHPDIGVPSDPEFLARLAAAIEADPAGWARAHLTVGVGSGLLALAFVAVRAHLREAGEDRWSALALPFAILGSVLFAMLPAMEFAPLAAAEAGVDIQAVQAALVPRFRPMVLSSALVFGVGALGFAAAVVRAGILRPGLAWLAAGALVVMAGARFVPLLAAQLYVGSTAGILALAPLAYAMWTRAGEAP